MRRTAAIVVLFALVLPMICWTGETAGAGGRLFPPLPPLPPILLHQDVEVLDNFSAMGRLNLALRPDGALELSRSGSYTQLNESRIYEIGEGLMGDPLQDVAVDRRGRSIAVWDGLRGGNMDVFIQRFDQSGEKLGPEMYIAGPKEDQTAAMVDDTSTGGFIVAYQADDLGDLSVYAQRYDTNGTKIGSAITVSTPTYSGAFPDLVVDSRDGFIITWWDERSGLGDIYAKRFDAAGNQLGSEIEVYVGATNDQVPCIAIAPDDGFVIAWSSIVSGTYDILAQRFGPTGNKLGGVIQVNALPQDGRFPAICSNSFGEFTIAYDRIFSKTVVFQRYDQNGSKLGGEVKSPGPAGNAFYPQLATTSSDGFVMVWEIELISPNAEIFLQRYDRSGIKIGSPMQLSRSVVYGVNGDVAVGPDDSFSVLWQNYTHWDNISIMMRLVIRPYAPSGWVMTGPVSPDHLWSWLNLAVNATYEDATQNSISCEWSGDNGGTWTDVPGNGSLSGAGNKTPIKVKATLSTDQSTTTPVLFALKLSYKFDQLPSVTLPVGFSVPVGDPVLATANATDPDGDFVTYKWAQTAGPPAAFNATTRNLSFDPSLPGNYSFTVTVSDGFGAGLPASINITVFEQPPDIELSTRNITMVPSRPRAGAAVNLSARIFNLGLSDTGPFRVRFLLDGSVLAEPDVSGLPPNASITLNASWRAKAGSHELRVMADGENKVNESRENNNNASMAFKVAASSSVEAGFPWPVVILLIVIIVAAVAALLYVRRRRAVTVVPYQPPAPQAHPPSAPVQPIPEVPPVRPAVAPGPSETAPAIPPAGQPPQAPPGSGAQVAWDRPAPPHP